LPIAQPGVSASSQPAQSRAGGGALVRLVSPSDLDDADRKRMAMYAEINRPKPLEADLGAFVRQRWMIFRNHRNQGNNPINARLLRSQRMFEGKYDPEKLAAIKEFGGSEVYSRMVAVKCRGATSLLRDVYLGNDRPWDIEPQPDPPIPAEVQRSIIQLLMVETQTMQAAGQPVMQDQVHMRYVGLMHAAQQAARRNAMLQADAAADKIDDILRGGKFYEALAEFLVDLPLFPFAVLKGPVVRMVPELAWVQGHPLMQKKPRMFWERIDPFNFYWSPGVARIQDAEVIERKRLTRTDLNDLLGLPGYNEAAIRAALQDYDMGLREWLDYPDTEQALNEGRENPTFNQSHMIDAIEYHGNIQGQLLLDQGIDRRLIPDLDRDYAVQTWVVGRYTIKTQLNPNPRQRHPYYATSFEKVPGTILGHGIPDLLEDMQEMANAALRSLVNNMSIASGPQVVVNDERLAPTENGDSLYPWKRWHVMDSPVSGQSQKPIEFFQPQSNSQELLTVYKEISNLADDISAIPRYVTGESLSGGAGRTASGLSMLMGNSSKVLQTVAANVDGDVMRESLHGLYDMIMLTDTSGMLTGEEEIKVNGVNVAMQKETERQKQLQFAQITANPMDMQVLGIPGRAKILRALSSSLGLPDDIVPDDQTIENQVKAQQMVANVQHAAGGQPQEQPGRPPAKGATGQQAQKPSPTSHADHAPPFNAFNQGRGVPRNG
jgi:hypothetical protein